jgi:hypothetical protein
LLTSLPHPIILPTQTIGSGISQRAALTRAFSDDAVQGMKTSTVFITYTAIIKFAPDTVRRLDDVLQVPFEEIAHIEKEAEDRTTAFITNRLEQAQLNAANKKMNWKRNLEAAEACRDRDKLNTFFFIEVFREVRHVTITANMMHNIRKKV